MELARLVLDYLRVLAWPAVLIVAVFFFRVQLGSLVERVTEASAFGGTVKLESQARQVQEAVASFSSPGSLDRKTASGQNETGNRQNDGISSVGNIVRAWAEVEIVAKRIYEQMGNQPRRGVFVLRVVEDLVSRELISPDAAGVVRELFEIRNKLVHDPSVVLTANAADALLIAIKNFRITLENISSNFPTTQEGQKRG